MLGSNVGRFVGTVDNQDNDHACKDTARDDTDHNAPENSPELLLSEVAAGGSAVVVAETTSIIVCGNPVVVVVIEHRS